LLGADHAKGRCLCGSVRFRIRFPTLWSAHCHCTLCQRAHGAGFVTWVGVSDERFEVLAGDTLRWYGSTAEAERGFCTRCGSTVLFRSLKWPGEMHVTVANVDDPLDREPDKHVFTESRAHWIQELPDGG
jgi:hypothetical protein